MIKKILQLLSENSLISQRRIAEYLDISLGSVNKYIKKLLEEEFIEIENISYREKKYYLTEKGKEILGENKKISLAVVLLAGKSKNLKKSIGELEIENETIVERHIRLLTELQIEKIILVVGYNSNFYFNLKKKYKNIEIVENKNYLNTGNMYSLYLARNLIQKDFLLIDGDIIYSKNLVEDLIKNENKNIGIVDRNIELQDDAVFVEIEDNRLENISKDRYSLQNISGQLIGINKIQYRNYLKMIDRFSNIKNSLYFYEYFFKDKNIFEEFFCLEEENLVWGEIDNKKQYRYILENILPKLKEEEWKQQ